MDHYCLRWPRKPGHFGQKTVKSNKFNCDMNAKRYKTANARQATAPKVERMEIAKLPSFLFSFFIYCRKAILLAAHAAAITVQPNAILTMIFFPFSNGFVSIGTRKPQIRSHMIILIRNKSEQKRINNNISSFRSHQLILATEANVTRFICCVCNLCTQLARNALALKSNTEYAVCEHIPMW